MVGRTAKRLQALPVPFAGGQPTYADDNYLQYCKATSAPADGPGVHAMPLPKPLPLRCVMPAGMLVLIALAAPALPAVAVSLTVELNKLEAQG